jgi:hypothetical protein
MEHILFFSVLAIAGILFAQVEVEIEGKDGWASALPTKKLNAWFWKIIFSGRVADKYHASILAFVFILTHLSFAFQTWTWSIELKILSFNILFWVLEDFSWFVLNPYFGIKKFSKENIWWHRNRWFICMPVEYWVGIPLAITLYILSA